MYVCMYVFLPEDGHKTETCSGYWINIQTSVALDGNPKPDTYFNLKIISLREYRFS
jgi:hypothetical protein